MQQHLRPHELAAARRNAPPPRPLVRRRFRDSNGWIRAAIVLVVAFIVAFFGWPALQNEISSRGGWFDTPPFRTPDNRIPDPPDWVRNMPDRQPPPSRRGYGNGWRECRPGPSGWDCGGPPSDQRGRRW